MRVRPVVFVGVPALLAGLLGLAAADEPSTAFGSPLLPSGQVRLVDGQLQSASTVRDILIDGVRPSADEGKQRLPQPSALGGAAAAVVEQSGEGGTVSASALIGGHSVETADAGDLDGDGHDDVIVLVSQLSSAVLQARSGADGRLLWSTRPTEGSFVFGTATGRDLTGDGVPDVMLTAFADVAHDDEGEGPGGQLYRSTTTFTQTYGVLSGTDGLPVWQRSVAGSVVETQTSASDDLGGYAEEYRYTVTDGFVLPLVAGDVNRDGAADVALSVVSLEYVERYDERRILVAGRSAVEQELASSTEAAVLDGRSGAPVAERTVGDQAAVSVLVPAGDLDRDGSPELLWTTEPEPEYSSTCLQVTDRRLCQESQPPVTATLELLRGKDLSLVWSARSQGRFLFAFPLGADVDGDGTADLGSYGIGPGWRADVISGADGRVLWSTDDDGSVAFLTGVSDGPAGRTATVTRFTSGTTLAGETFLEAATERRAAATGRLTSTTVRRVGVTPPGSGDTAGTGTGTVWFTPDADGDGTPELLTDLSVAAGRIGQAGAAVRSLLVVERHATGAVVRSSEDDDQRSVQPFGDLDGDALLDLRTDRFGQDAEGFRRLDVEMRSARDGALLWTERLHGDETAAITADHDGDGGNEVLVLRDTDQGVRLDAVSGRDGSVRWSRLLPGPHDTSGG